MLEGKPRATWAALFVVTAVAALAAGVAAVVVDAGKAAAAPVPTRATIEATQFSVPSAQVGEGFAVCPGNKRAVGGGVVPTGPAGFGIEVFANGPLDASGVTVQTEDGDIAKQWYAAVINLTAERRTFRVFAICSSTSEATIEVTQFSVGKNQVGEGFAGCPGTKRALGGGVVQSGPAGFGTSVAASGPLDASGITAQTVTGDVAKQWYAAVANYTSLSDHTYRVFAICSGRSAARIKATPLFTVGELQASERFAACSGDKRALGGGAIQSGPASLSFYQRASGPLDASGEPLRTGDGDIAKQWYVAQGNDSDINRRFKVFAICE